ncbi:MAG: hypothetical protein K8T25_21030 [Planctomycetia bacterium]|nr:hypothetical protein [Planctomycetia bacterium]
MKKSTLIYVAVAALILIVLFLRIPRLNPDGVNITRHSLNGDQMSIDCRMYKPFSIRLEHGLRASTSINPSEKKPGIYLDTSKELRRSETAADFASHYDLLRGEYYVQIHFSRNPKLTVDANGLPTELTAWTPLDPAKVEWVLSHQNATLGDGVGIDVLYFSKSAEQVEYLRMYAGTSSQ